MTIIDKIAKLINDGSGRVLAQTRWSTENKALAARVAMYRQYMDGDQDSGLNEQMRQLLNLKEGQDFNYNKCSDAVETITNRLQVLSMSADGVGGEAGAERANKWASDLLDWNYFDSLQIEVYDDAYRDGDGYLMVSWDNEARKPVFTREPAFDGESGMLVLHNRADPAVIEVAIKVWNETLDENKDVTRVNLYYADRVEKYIVREGQSEQYIDPDEPEVWPLPWVNPRTRAPIGVPVVQFPARGQGQQKDAHGMSKLKNIVPLQHGLNVTMHSMVGTALLGAFPVNVIIGYPAPAKVLPGMFYEIVPTDASGKTMRPGEEVANWLKSIRLDQIKGAALTPFIDTIMWFDNAISKTAHIPDPEGANISGEALKQRETNLLGEIRRAHIVLGNAWERVLRLAAAVQDAYGSEAAPVVQRWRAVWKDAQTRSETEKAQIINLVSKHLEGSDEIINQVGALLGLSEERIAEIKDQIEGSRDAQINALINQMPGFGSPAAQNGSITAAVGNGAVEPAL